MANQRHDRGLTSVLNTRPRSLAWDATTAIEALAAADTALWIWTPADDQMRFTGATRSLGLGPLAPECSGAAFTAVAIPQDRALAERLLKPQAEGSEVAIRLRMRDAETCLWRGVWLEDGLRAAGVVALETKFAGGNLDSLTGLLDRRTFLNRAAEILTQPGDYDLIVADLDRLRRLNEALGHERADMVLAALGSRLSAAFSMDVLPARVGEDEFAVLIPQGPGNPSERLRDAVEQPLRIAGFDIYPTVAIGAVSAEGGPDAPDVAELLRRAELAVERAKTAGRGKATACRDLVLRPICATPSCAAKSSPSSSRSSISTPGRWPALRPWPVGATPQGAWCRPTNSSA